MRSFGIPTLGIYQPFPDLNRLAKRWERAIFRRAISTPSKTGTLLLTKYRPRYLERPQRNCNPALPTRYWPALEASLGGAPSAPTLAASWKPREQVQRKDLSGSTADGSLLKGMGPRRSRSRALGAAANLPSTAWKSTHLERGVRRSACFDLTVYPVTPGPRPSVSLGACRRALHRSRKTRVSPRHVPVSARAESGISWRCRRRIVQRGSMLEWSQPMEL